jgi:serine/threonine protein kinase
LSENSSAFIFGNYRLDQVLGEGGMGTVYEAYDLSLDRTVAIKVLKRELSEDQKFIATFLREVEITSSLSHPNIVQVYTFGEVEGQYYLVMEHIGHVTLDDELARRKRLTEAEVIDIGIGVASGLQFAFEQGGLIHRDIKPGNVLFGADRIPKVVDFGLALTPETADHFAGEIWGTPYYVSPERLEGIPEDFRSDMYSLGTSLYHLLVGRPPFDATTAEIVATKHLTEQPLPIKTFAPYVSDQTSYAILRAMARHPDQRFQSYQEFIGQLEDSKRRLHSQAQQAAHSPASQTVNVTAQVETAEEEKLMKTLLIAGGAVIGLVVIGVTIWLILANQQ